MTITASVAVSNLACATPNYLNTILTELGGSNIGEAAPAAEPEQAAGSCPVTENNVSCSNSGISGSCFLLFAPRWFAAAAEEFVDH